MNLPFSQACENNKTPILTQLKRHLRQSKQVLEIGSGTGQHAVHFAEQLPHLHWQTSDLFINHDVINARIDQLPRKNLQRPISLDLNNTWDLTSLTEPVDAIFTANTLHIISWSLVKKFFEQAANNLSNEGVLCIYGPFNYQGKFTSESNENFNFWLKDRDINSGIRDFEAIVKLATKAKLKLIEDNTMPANNRLLVFQK